MEIYIGDVAYIKEIYNLNGADMNETYNGHIAHI